MGVEEAPKRRRRREAARRREEQRWAAKSGPVTTRHVDPVELRQAKPPPQEPLSARLTAFASPRATPALVPATELREAADEQDRRIARLDQEAQPASDRVSRAVHDGEGPEPADDAAPAAHQLRQAPSPAPGDVSDAG